MSCVRMRHRFLPVAQRDVGIQILNAAAACIRQGNQMPGSVAVSANGLLVEQVISFIQIATARGDRVEVFSLDGRGGR